MDARLSCAEATYPDELDEELDMFPTLSPNAVVGLPYDRLRSADGRESASGSCRSSSACTCSATRGSGAGCRRLPATLIFQEAAVPI